MNFQETTIDDFTGVLDLYRRVAVTPGGLARLSDEIDENYVSSFMSKTINNGVGLVALDENSQIVGEIHAYKTGLYCFSHVLSELTLAVDPNFQGKGIGRKLLSHLLSKVIDSYPEITRVELIARESNQKAILLYKSLGFVTEGRLLGRIRNIDNTFESDIPMAWIRT